MKGILVFVVALAMVGCRNDAVPGQSELKLGASGFRFSAEVVVSLDSVLVDSRCPEDVECIWAGNAQAQFTCLTNNGQIIFDLNTNHSFTADTLINGYRIKLQDLTPHPKSGMVIPQKDYRAILQITKE